MIQAAAHKPYRPLLLRYVDTHCFSHSCELAFTQTWRTKILPCSPSCLMLLILRPKNWQNEHGTQRYGPQRDMVNPSTSFRKLVSSTMYSLSVKANLQQAQRLQHNWRAAQTVQTYVPQDLTSNTSPTPTVASVLPASPKPRHCLDLRTTMCKLHSKAEESSSQHRQNMVHSDALYSPPSPLSLSVPAASSPDRDVIGSLASNVQQAYSDRPDEFTSQCELCEKTSSIVAFHHRSTTLPENPTSIVGQGDMCQPTRCKVLQARQSPPVEMGRELTDCPIDTDGVNSTVDDEDG